MGLSMQPQRGGFIFGGNTGVGPEELKRRRQIAEALMAQQVRPQTAWDGLGNAARSIAGALMARSANKEEAAARQAAQERFASLFSSQSPQAMPAPAAAPASQAAPAAPAQPDREAVIQALIAQESGGRPDARSPKGAMGLMQIMPQTARDPGFGLPNIFEVGRAQGFNVPDESDATLNALLADPKVNEAFGTAYFGKMQDRYGGDMDKALAAYNAGPGAVDKFGGVPPYQETQDYVRGINARLGRGAGPAQAGPQPAPAAAPGGGNAGPQGVDAIPTEALMAAYSDPYLAPEQRQIVGMMLEQRLAKPEGMTPYQQAQLALKQQEMAMRASGQWSPGTNVTVNNQGGPEVGTIPQGWQLVGDGKESPYRMEPIPGGPADIKLGQENFKAANQAQQMLTVIDGIEADPQLGNALGFGSFMPDIPGYNTSPRARLDQLSGQAFLQAFESLKGGGQITEVEGTKATQAIARLRQSQTESEYRAALKDLRAVLEGVSARLSPQGGREGQGVTVPQAGGGVAVPQGQPQPAPQPNGGRDRPQRGQVIDGYRFLGGDPADPNSWEKL